MFDPAWDNGCSGCTGFVSALGDLSPLNNGDTTFVVVSRAPLVKLQAYKTQKGWDIFRSNAEMGGKDRASGPV